MELESTQLISTCSMDNKELQYIHTVHNVFVS